MTTLGDSKIVELMSNRIEPFSLDQVGPSSYDCKLGKGFKVLDVPQGFITLPVEHEIKYTDVPLTNGYYPLLPGQFALASTEEWVEMPSNLDAHVDGRSSVGRLGLIVHCTAAYIDPGFAGQITLELYNASGVVIMIKPGAPICQMVFNMVDGCKTPYNKRDKSKYMLQLGPTGSMLHLENKL